MATQRANTHNRLPCQQLYKLTNNLANNKWTQVVKFTSADPMDSKLVTMTGREPRTEKPKDPLVLVRSTQRGELQDSSALNMGRGPSEAKRSSTLNSLKFGNLTVRFVLHAVEDDERYDKAAQSMTNVLYYVC